MMTKTDIQTVLDAMHIVDSCVGLKNYFHDKPDGTERRLDRVVDDAIAILKSELTKLNSHLDAVIADCEKDALAEPSEPVYWQWRRKDKPWANEYIFAMELQATTDDSEVRKLFTHPASKPAPLTFEQVEDCFPEDTIVSTSGSVLASAQWLHDFARAVEAAVWGKMNGK